MSWFHRTFLFLRIGNGLTSFWLDESILIKTISSRGMHACVHVIGLPCPNPSNQKNPSVPIANWQTSVIPKWFLVLEFTQRLHIYEVIYIFRLQLPVKFVVLLRAACLSPEEGKRKLVHSRFFLPLEPWTNSKTVQCVQYLIRMYLPCLAVNQTHH